MILFLVNNEAYNQEDQRVKRAQRMVLQRRYDAINGNQPEIPDHDIDRIQ